MTIINVLSNLLYPITSLSPQLLKFLRENSQCNISRCQVHREPISSAINVILNTTTTGQFQQNLNDAKIDKLLHLSMEIGLSNGKIIRLEKNERIAITVIKAFSLHNSMEVQANNNTLFDWMEAAKKVLGDKFYTYDGYTNNCQDFIMSFLRGNRCLTPELQAFVKQNTSQLFSNIPRSRNFMNSVTDLGAKIDVISNGGSFKKNKYVSFSQDYYHKNCKGAGISYKDMLRSKELKEAYLKHKS